MTKKKKEFVKEGSLFNFDLIHYFKTGERLRVEDCEIAIEDSVLCFNTEIDSGADRLELAFRSGKYLVLNGDDDDVCGHYHLSRDPYDLRCDLQESNSNHITTSFRCIRQAGLSLKDIKVVDTAKDDGGVSNSRKRGWKKFRESIPQGATLYIYREFNKETDRCDGEITGISWHRAGSMLFKVGDVSYIAGMDSGSYFISQLVNHPKTVDEAYKSLKPRRVVSWEKTTGLQAQRQGEWFLIPRDDMEATNMKEKVALPHGKGSNPHTPQWYEKGSDGRHYVKGTLHHEEHGTSDIGSTDTLHEAIESTAVASWSVQGVD